MSKPSKIFYKTVWLDWNQPLVGLCFPPAGELPYRYEADSTRYKKLDNVPPYTENTWAVIGMSSFDRPMLIADPIHAERMATALGGYTGTEERSEESQL